MVLIGDLLAVDSPGLDFRLVRGPGRRVRGKDGLLLLVLIAIYLEDHISF